MTSYRQRVQNIQFVRFNRAGRSRVGDGGTQV